MVMPKGHTYKILDCKNSHCSEKIALKNKSKFCRKCFSKINSKKQRDKYKNNNKVKLVEKKCTKCKKIKLIKEFRKVKTSKGGYFSYCKRCKRIYDRDSRYNLLEGQYDKLLKKQKGKCAICKASVPGTHNHRHSFCVDHDHVTGKVRGLLCNSCNRGLGLLGDSLVNLKNAIFYLKGEYS